MESIVSSSSSSGSASSTSTSSTSSSSSSLSSMSSSLATAITNVLDEYDYITSINILLENEHDECSKSTVTSSLLLTPQRNTKFIRPIRIQIHKKDLLNSKFTNSYVRVTQDLLNLLEQNQQQNHQHHHHLHHVKILKFHIQIVKLLVELTSPSELLFINRNLIYSQLKNDEINSNQNMNLETISADLSTNDQSAEKQSPSNVTNASINRFKDTFILNDYISLILESLSFFIRQLESDKIILEHRQLILNALILNLCLIRNLAFDKNDTTISDNASYAFNSSSGHTTTNGSSTSLNSANFILKAKRSKFNIIIIKLLDLNLSNILFNLIRNLNLKNDPKTEFVLHSLSCQILCLLFSKLNSNQQQQNQQQQSQSQQNDPKMDTNETSKENEFNSSAYDNKQCKLKLTKLAIYLCKTETFSKLIEVLLNHLKTPNELHLYFDVSYFLWFLKFMISNYILKELNLEDEEEKEMAEPKGNEQAEANSSSNRPFINCSVNTKKSLLNYDLISFVTFKMFDSFELLIFDSNIKNMDRIRVFKDVQENEIFCKPQSKEQAFNDGVIFSSKSPKKMRLEFEITAHQRYKTRPSKVVNTNYLRTLYLSIGCLHELIDCINHHLDCLNGLNVKKKKSKLANKLKIKKQKQQHQQQNGQVQSSETTDLEDDDESEDNIDSNNDPADPQQQQKQNLGDTENSQNDHDDPFYLKFLNEFLNFDELKQSFALLMRFYCYNQHVYTNSLIKNILLTNKLFLNTFKLVTNYINDKNKGRHRKRKQMDCTDDHGRQIITKDNAPPFICIKTIYNMYSNPDTSFILRHVLAQFVNNDPVLNRCVIDLLDTLMRECDRREYLFHMNLALALANIAILENFRLLDQRTKDLVSNMLSQIRSLCKHKPNLANKILFDVRHNHEHQNRSSRPKKDPKTNPINPSNSSSNKSSSSSITTSTSSWSSLRSSTSVSLSSDASPTAKSRSLPPQSKTKKLRMSLSRQPRHSSSSSSSIVSSSSSSSSPSKLNYQPKYSREAGPFNYCILPRHRKKNRFHTDNVTKEIRLLIENEFLFCMRSLDAFSKNSSSIGDQNNHQFTEPNKILTNFIIKNDHLYRILKYLIQLLELSSSYKITSWQIYNCLLSMKFESLDELKLEDKSTLYPDDSDKQDENLESKYTSLRIACSSPEYAIQLKHAYIKYLVEKLCTKSRRTKGAIYWMFNRMRRIRLYLTSPNKDRYFNVMLNENNIAASETTPNRIISSVFESKLIGLYHSYKIGIPFIPFTYELQQVFHSCDFSHLFNILGLISSSKRFPYIPHDWLDENITKLTDCVSIMEKCLCV